MDSRDHLAQAQPTAAPHATAAVVGEPINRVLRAHQESIDDWDFSGDIRELHARAEEMIFEFKLEIPIPCLTVEPLRGACGHFRHGRNGFGLRDEIAIDRFHLMVSSRAQVLDTLLHELIHSWEEHHGNPGKGNYHTVSFREKARSLGLTVDEKGFSDCVPSAGSPFAAFLEKHKVEAPTATQAAPPAKPKRGSKLKLYECPCGVKVRVGRSRFNAKCLDCGGLFVLKDPVEVGKALMAKPEAE